MNKVFTDRFWAFFKEGTPESMARIVLLLTVICACSAMIIQAVKGTITMELLIGYGLFMTPSALLKWLQKSNENNKPSI